MLSHIIRRVGLCAVLATSFAACDADDGGSEPAGGPAVGGKADDTTAGPIGALAAGTQGSGYVAGDAVHVYVVEAREGSVINARVVRASGDLDPTAFLFNGLAAAQADTYESPSHGFTNDDASIEAAWTVPRRGELLLVIGAGGNSAGEFEVELSCHEDSPVPCAEGDEDSELAFCESVRNAFLECYESDAEDDEHCGDWYVFEDTLDDDNCCELWDERDLPSEDFCP